MVEGVPSEVKPSLDNLSQNNKESASSPPKSPTQTDHELWSPGPYIILKAQSSTDDQPPDSKKVSHYPQGATITIERIAELTWCNLVRGQLENGEWLTLEDTEKDEHWAEESDVEFTPGYYKVLNQTYATKGIEKNSLRGQTFHIGAKIQVTYVQAYLEESRIRGRITNGDWVSIYALDTNKEFLKKEGKYRDNQRLYAISLSHKIREIQIHNTDYKGTEYKHQVLVHYVGFSELYDEWIALKSGRILDGKPSGYEVGDLYKHKEN